jgi:hypothetical protein
LKEIIMGAFVSMQTMVASLAYARELTRLRLSVTFLDSGAREIKQRLSRLSPWFGHGAAIG